LKNEQMLTSELSQQVAEIVREAKAGNSEAQGWLLRTFPGHSLWLRELVFDTKAKTPAPTPQAHKAGSTEYMAAKDVVDIILTYAQQRQLIAEVTIAPSSYLHFAEMTDDERAELTKLRGVPSRKQIAAACKFAGTTLEEARAKRLNDTPETRAAARQLFGI